MVIVPDNVKPAEPEDMIVAAAPKVILLVQVTVPPVFIKAPELETPVPLSVTAPQVEID